MITLAIETATRAVGVALGGDDGLVGAIEINRGRRHAEVLAPAIEFLCRSSQIAIGEIGAIGVDVGPGLFTGMRVGIATAKAMGYALKVPVVGVCSLDVLAHPFGQRHRLIAAVVDARKGEVFYAFYRPSPDGAQRVTEARAGSLEDFNADVAARGQQVLAVGDGAWRYRHEFGPGVEAADEVGPSAVSLAHLARSRALHADVDGTADVRPMYLRAPDAEINWSTR